MAEKTLKLTIKVEQMPSMSNLTCVHTIKELLFPDIEYAKKFDAEALVKQTRSIFRKLPYYNYVTVTLSAYGSEAFDKEHTLMSRLYIRRDGILVAGRWYEKEGRYMGTPDDKDLAQSNIKHVYEDIREFALAGNMLYDETRNQKTTA